MQTRISRRQLLAGAAQVSALGALTLIPQARGAATAPASTKLNIGVATQGFPTLSNAALARELSGAGIRLIQLFLSQTDSKFWRYNEHADVSSLTPARCREIAGIYRDAGITIHSLGVYANLIHPDPAERKANLEYFEAMMNIGEHMGVNAFISEAGHYRDPKEPEPRIQH